MVGTVAVGIKQALTDICRQIAFAAGTLGMSGARKVDKAGRANERGCAAYTPGRACAAIRCAWRVAASASDKITGLIGRARTLTSPGAHRNRRRTSGGERGTLRVGSAVDEVTGLTCGTCTLTFPGARRIGRGAVAPLL